jgi:mRNA (guanine-N7-)-methyltransferase
MRPVVSTLPYNPRHRLTPAGSVLTPMTQDEIQLYKNYRGIGTQRLTNKRKRGPSREPDDLKDRPTKRRAGDVEKVVEHCKPPLSSLLSCSIHPLSPLPKII